MTHPNPSIPLFVAAAYDALIEEQLEAGARWRQMFPITDEARALMREREQAENQRRVLLVEAHQPTHEASSDCCCGEHSESQAGYFLHLYEIVEDDHRQQMGCDS